MQYPNTPLQKDNMREENCDFQTIPAISVLHKAVLTSGARDARFGQSLSKKKQNPFKKKHDFSHTIFHATVSIFWELDIPYPIL